MNAVASMFQGNPFSTPVGQLVERATDGAQPAEDWTLLMAVCDAVNDTEEGPRDALRAIRRRLAASAGRSNSAVQYSLSVLETCAKNCGHRFHLAIARRDFLDELVRLIGPKNEPPRQVQERVLGLLQAWADAFRGRPELREVEKLVEELRSRGVEFPMTDLDAMAPINTPARSVPPPPTSPSSAAAAAAVESGPASPGKRPPPPQLAATAEQPPQQKQPPQQQRAVTQRRAQTPSPEQLAKLRSELDVVQGNVKVFNEMLSELAPDSIQSEDLSLLQELNRTNRQMQQRLVDLIDLIANDEVVGELLRINDDLNNAFLRFDRFERYRAANRQQSLPQQQQQQPAPPPFNPMFNRPDGQTSGQQQQQPQPPPLIDLTTPDEQPSAAAAAPSSLGEQLAALRVSQAAAAPAAAASSSGGEALERSDEFDMFASSRQAFDRSRAGLGGDAAYSGAAEPQLPGGLQNGLAQRASGGTNNDAVGGGGGGVSSADFDLFLRQQQQQHPQQGPPQPPPASSSAAAASSSSSRTLKHKDDQSEDTLFAL